MSLFASMAAATECEDPFSASEDRQSPGSQVRGDNSRTNSRNHGSISDSQCEVVRSVFHADALLWEKHCAGGGA